MIARLRLELGLVGCFLRGGSGPRAVLVTACTALVSGLLMVALTVVLFGRSFEPGSEQVSNLLSDDGVRGGYVLALLLICVAPLALLRQVVRLGTATREQRLAALRLAGATPAEVRRLGALEVGLPSLVGGLLGYLVFGFLRLILGGAQTGRPGMTFAEAEIARELRLVPVTVHPTGWQVLLVVLVVALTGVLAGATASRSVLISPLGVSRRAPRSAPRPWAALLLLVAVPLSVATYTGTGAESELYAFAFVAALVVGLLGLAPWVAYRVGMAVVARASTVPVLIAGRRLATDARPAGRAAAAVGAITMVAGGGGALLSALPDSGPGGFESVDALYTVPIVLCGVVLVAALLLVVFSMAVHGVESLMDHKRSVASLAVLGATREDLELTQRWEVGLVAMPMAVIGVLIGSVPGLFLLGVANRYAWIPLVVDVVAVLLVWLAVRASTRLSRPWLIRAAAPASLRTP